MLHNLGQSNYHIFLAKLWRFMEIKEGKGRLENKKECSKWEHWKKHSFTIPKGNGEKDYIEVSNKDGSVVVLNPANDARGSNVIFENKIQPDSDKQKWLRGKTDPEGWFTLKNVKSEKFLTAATATTTIITG
jgi:hypothetical protein